MFRFLLFFSTFLPAVASHSSVILFQSDFESAVDTGSAIVDSGRSLEKGFGNVSIGSFGSLGSSALVFNNDLGNQYESVNLALGNGFDNYQIEFDLETQGLANRRHSFRVLADTPTVQTLNFNNCCSNTISTFNPFSGSVSNNIGVLQDNVKMSVLMDIDLVNDLWSIDISGVGSYEGGFFSRSGDVNSLRFSLAPAFGGAVPTGVYAAIDNLTVSSRTAVAAVSEPNPVYLIPLLIIVAAYRRRSLIS